MSSQENRVFEASPISMSEDDWRFIRSMRALPTAARDEAIKVLDSLTTLSDLECQAALEELGEKLSGARAAEPGSELTSPDLL